MKTSEKIYVFKPVLEDGTKPAGALICTCGCNDGTYLRLDGSTDFYSADEAGERMLCEIDVEDLPLVKELRSDIEKIGNKISDLHTLVDLHKTCSRELQKDLAVLRERLMQAEEYIKSMNNGAREILNAGLICKAVISTGEIAVYKS